MAGPTNLFIPFPSAEELLVHLKTHTNLSTSDMGGAGAAGYAGLLTQSLMRGGAAASQLLPSALSLQVMQEGIRGYYLFH